tara:strand:+ start:1447 stop:1725 length:279 start_codon:yes stop_codon:yes gene_type:complete
MVKLEVDFTDIINNNIILSILAGLISVLVLFLDKCVFIKTDEQINYISYIKIFLLVFLISLLILFIKEKLNSETDIIFNDNNDIQLAQEAPF